MMNDVYTCMKNMPPSIAGFTVSNPDDTYTIVLNARMTNERLMEAYRHEIEHIENNDFEKYDVQEIEQNAHK